jgi:hypothetical protein
MIGERIEAEIRSGKIIQSAMSNVEEPFNGSRKKGNADLVMMSSLEVGPFQPNNPQATSIIHLSSPIHQFLTPFPPTL